MNALPRFVLGEIKEGSDDDVTVRDRRHGGCVVAKFHVRAALGGQEKAIERARLFCKRYEAEAHEASDAATAGRRVGLRARERAK